jgi:hypothetical protein
VISATPRIASTKEYAKFFGKNFAQRLFAVARASLFCGTILCVVFGYVASRKEKIVVSKNIAERDGASIGI